MIFEDFISYKTFYYFLKDDSCLDLGLFEDATQEYKSFIDNGYKTEDFYKIYEPIKTGTKDIVLLKTKYGTFVFHLYSNHEYSKEFLEKNSKIKPCALFGTHRVSETHQIGVAEKGEIKRYLYYGEDEHILEGEKQTTYEKKNKLKFKLDEEGFFTDSIDEEIVYDYASDFLGLDRSEDVEILDFKYYKYKPFAEESVFNTNIDEYVIYRIHENLERQNLNEITFYFTKYYDDAMLDCSCILKEGEDVYCIFSKNIKNIKSKSEFKKLFFSCLKVLETADFRKYKKPSLSYYFHTRMMEEFPYNICMGLIENEDRGNLTLSLTNVNKAQISQDEMTQNMIIIKDFKPKYYKYVHKFILKQMKKSAI
ncbi:MAG: hypothetical protein IJ310_01200 [Clostridia bacterium]|nr:hypothetical protein [Clostridia bacterium]